MTDAEWAIKALERLKKLRNVIDDPNPRIGLLLGWSIPESCWQADDLERMLVSMSNGKSMNDAAREAKAGRAA